MSSVRNTESFSLVLKWTGNLSTTCWCPVISTSLMEPRSTYRNLAWRPSASRLEQVNPTTYSPHCSSQYEIRWVGGTTRVSNVVTGAVRKTPCNCILPSLGIGQRPLLVFPHDMDLRQAGQII